MKAEIQAGLLYPLVEGNPDALVIQCSSPKFQDAFHDFVRKELGVTMPAVIAIPGSAGSFGVQVSLPKYWYAFRNHIQLLSENYGFGRVIVITHEDCKGYQQFARWLGKFVDLSKAQRDHVKSLAEYIRREYVTNAKFELYYAAIAEQSGKRVARFDRIL